MVAVHLNQLMRSSSCVYVRELPLFDATERFRSFFYLAVCLEDICWQVYLEECVRTIGVIVAPLVE